MPNPLRAHGARLTVLAAGEITDDGLQWIDVIPTADKVRNGRWYFTITRDDLDTFAASIAASPGLIPIDYDHEGREGSTRAAGWFTGKTEIVDADSGPMLRAEVKWTPKAAEEIRAGEYKRLSPEFSFKRKDAKTGLLTEADRIEASTLTNRPFFRELSPVGAEVVWAPGYGFEQIRQKLHAALNPGPIDTARYWVMDVAAGAALVQEYQTSRTWVVPYTTVAGEVIPAASTEWTEAQQEWVAAAREAARQNTGRKPFTPEGDTDMPDLKVIAKALGLPEDADEDTINAKLAERETERENLSKENAELKAQAGSDNEITKVREELAAERVKRISAERDQVLDQAVRDGRLVPAQRDAVVAAFGAESPTDDNVVALKAFVEASPARKSGEVGTGKPGEEEPDLTAAAKKFRTDGDTDVDEESLTLHVKAEQLLKQDGKVAYTTEEYLAAVERVEAGETPAVA